MKYKCKILSGEELTNENIIQTVEAGYYPAATFTKAKSYHGRPITISFVIFIHKTEGKGDTKTESGNQTSPEVNNEGKRRPGRPKGSGKEKATSEIEDTIEKIKE
jgi:hypothetical protein